MKDKEKDKENIMELGNGNISPPFMRGTRKGARKMKKALTTLTTILFVSLIFSGMSFAAFVCSDCHTMHNMQGGVEITASGDEAGNLLTADSCLACHTGTNDGTNFIPYVMATSEPTFGTNTLAGGNFWWVEQTDSDAKGHNVVSTNEDGVLSAAPGFSTGGCGSPNCHASLHEASCEGCHMSPAHHTPSDGYVSAAPWYRWLSGHQGGADLGVKGIEVADRGYAATKSSHNEYLGNVATKTSAGGFAACGSTTTGFCTGCHGDFHIQDATATGATPWTRHPADFVIPGTTGSEYNSMSTDYNPNTPVARPAGFNWAGGIGAISATATSGTDMVMCLSCHVAHGSPYDDMLRWDYEAMEVETDGAAAGTGCFVCHTGKDGA